MPGLIWITRARPAADATARRVRDLGFEPVVAPLLNIRTIPDAAIDLAGVGALAFTSANGVEAFAALSPGRSIRVFTVGDATAAAARAAAFADVASASGDADALIRLIAAEGPRIRGDVLYPAAAEPARDLIGPLAGQGVSVRQVAVYETVVTPPDAALLACLPQLAGVLLHSARAAAALAEALDAHPAPHLVAYCLSAQVARPLAGRVATCVAASPDEASLLKTLPR
ncbi:MAG TPA: uroporphyrinogen-III synthase [Caulobacteraceae bacterium]|jgi:uroporphyrinogen-III synthase